MFVSETLLRPRFPPSPRSHLLPQLPYARVLQLVQDRLNYILVPESPGMEHGTARVVFELRARKKSSCSGVGILEKLLIAYGSLTRMTTSINLTNAVKQSLHFLLLQI